MEGRRRKKKETCSLTIPDVNTDCVLFYASEGSNNSCISEGFNHNPGDDTIGNMEGTE